MNIQTFKLSVLEKSILAGLIFSIMISFVNFAGKCGNISTKVLRLHIVANSDSIQDQELKLRIKDKIQSFFSKYSWKNLEEALVCIVKNKYLIESIAKDEINNSGYEYLVKVDVEDNVPFGTRRYDSKFVLPAGHYRSLKVIIGDGNGKNWWCVLFPHMCTPAAQKPENRNVLEKTLESSELEIVENNKVNYKMKFKVLEVFESARDGVLKSKSSIKTKILKNKTMDYFSKPLTQIYSVLRIGKIKTSKFKNKTFSRIKNSTSFQALRNSKNIKNCYSN